MVAARGVGKQENRNRRELDVDGVKLAALCLFNLDVPGQRDDCRHPQRLVLVTRPREPLVALHLLDGLTVPAPQGDRAGAFAAPHVDGQVDAVLGLLHLGAEDRLDVLVVQVAAHEESCRRALGGVQGVGLNVATRVEIVALEFNVQGALVDIGLLGVVVRAVEARDAERLCFGPEQQR